ncbi:hypothetical protein GCM10009555_056410 [Acrocarpospora macrocephala]|uniref:VTT domain-containing protein n=1 Tax=Acrocarpospora macrocephala TaxID=150177 RepID=A0A5M3WNY7_9ACTN|nr:VTT domain-containing protein [Acrocarpospora macrocephala]GES08473.1 hypothetical protein Amac_020690 [Acrocarpospora macrocephala]
MSELPEFIATLLSALDRESPAIVGLTLLFLLAMEGTLLVGLLVPGDAALLVAGMALHGPWEIAGVAAAGIVGCFLSASGGYLIGSRFGPQLRVGRVGGWVGRERWERAERAMADLAVGGTALAVAYFMPVVHALTPILAGAFGVSYRKFMVRAMIGGTAWVTGYLILGSVAGGVIRRNLDLVVPLVALVALVAAAIPVVRRLRRRRHERRQPVGTREP